MTHPICISGLQRVRLRHAQPEATLERSRRSRVGRHRRRVRADRERVRVRKPRQDSQDFRRRSGDDQLTFTFLAGFTKKRCNYGFLSPLALIPVEQVKEKLDRLPLGI